MLFDVVLNRIETKSYKVSPEKKSKSETPIVIRRSLRTQGKKPDSAGLKDDFSEPTKKSTTLKTQVSPNTSPRKLGPISMRDANTCSEADEPLVNNILSVCKGSRLEDGDGEKKCYRVRASIDLDSMELKPENVARVVPNRILSVKFFPSADLKMVVVGNKYGNLGFWNADSDNDGIYMYHPHPSPISAVLIQPFSLNKVLLIQISQLYIFATKIICILAGIGFLWDKLGYHSLWFMLQIFCC